MALEHTMDAAETELALAHEEVRVRKLVAQLEEGGMVGHTGLTEHLLPVEDRSPHGGAELAERELELGLLQDLEAELHAIDRARVRLREGKFGFCSTCGGPIGALRLEAVPATEHCVEHA